MEFLQVFDENKNMINEKIERDLKKTLTGNKYFMVMLLFIQNGEKFLLQKTSPQRNSEIATTGGHVSFGFNSLETVIKESKEELNLILNEEELIHIDTIVNKNSYTEVYYTTKKIDIDKLKLQEEEVESVGWYTIDEIKELIKEDKFRKGNILPFNRVLEYIGKE